MPSFLIKPPPIAAALLNAFLGLLLVVAGIIALYALLPGVLDMPAPPHRWIAVPGAAQLLFVTCLGAVFGFMASAVLLWATPRRAGVARALALNTTVFAICMPAAFLACQGYLHWRSSFGLPAVVFVFVACGAVTAFIMASAARRLGIDANLAPRWVASLGGILAGLGVGAAIYSAGLEPLEFLPMVWLGLVTYFCLKPLPQKQTDGL